MWLWGPTTDGNLGPSSRIHIIASYEPATISAGYHCGLRARSEWSWSVRRLLGGADVVVEDLQHAMEEGPIRAMILAIRLVNWRHMASPSHNELKYTVTAYEPQKILLYSSTYDRLVLRSHIKTITDVDLQGPILLKRMNFTLSIDKSLHW